MSTAITILGNTGREVELRYSPNGTPIANFSIASNTVRRSSEGPKKKTDWYSVSAFGKQAETLAKYLTKGSQILVRGKLYLSAWQTRDGEPRVNADVLLQDFEFVGTNPDKAIDQPAVETAVTMNETVQAVQTAVGGETDEMAEMIAALNEMDAGDEAFAGQY
ncbi:MAG TPA: single-stranded DNA-binding protein [Pyrinomonadaceae bacterium]|nr:single-stranded DNA-binding protein [Pyrinomonadaceae bacterium]